MGCPLKVTWINNNPDTIWNRLAAKLGREPTNEEAADEVRRIMAENTVNRAARGKFPHQKRR